MRGRVACTPMKIAIAIAAMIVAACGGHTRPSVGAKEKPQGPSGETSSAADTTGSGETSLESEGSAGSEGPDDAGPKLDVAGVGSEGPAGDGCQKVDFLFVVDNSGSMQEEQAHLVASFPSFVAAIQDSVADDFRILITDTDESFAVDQCDEICPQNPEDTCVACATEDLCLDVPCAAFPPAPTCDDVLGAGRIHGPTGGPCGVAGPSRFLTDDQPDLASAFECIATVGTGASGERPMQAMTQAVSTLLEPGACNDGFLRDDAILVVTVISDEDDVVSDDGVVSPGTQTQWHDAVVAAKGGNEDAVVFLGLLSDVDVDGGQCPDTEPPIAAPAPRLRELAESFSRGQWGSVCADDYGPFFAQAIAVIDTACEAFEPAG